MIFNLLIFGLCVFLVVAVFILLSLALLRVFSQYPSVELKEYWKNHTTLFTVIWMVVPFLISSIIGYFWYVMFCVDILLPPIPELRIVAVFYMLSLLAYSAFDMRKLRLKGLNTEN
jgi:heme/copper-type cytochrome/quinol oxidase subunit 2